MSFLGDAGAATSRLRLRSGLHGQRSVHHAGIPPQTLRRSTNPRVPLRSGPHPLRLYKDLCNNSKTVPIADNETKER